MAKEDKKGNGSSDESTFNSDAQLKLDKAHNVIDRPEKFAAHFRNVAKSQTDIKKVIMEIVRECIESDVETRKHFKNLIREVENENWRGFLKTLGGKAFFGIWTLIVIVVTAIVNKFIHP